MVTATDLRLSARSLRRGAAESAAAAVAATAAGLAIMGLAGRSMSTSDFASFMAVWALVFGWAAILGALEQESARARAASPGPVDRTQLEVTAIVAAVSVVVMTAAVTALFDVLHLQSVLVAFLVVVSAAVFPLLFTARGFLAGSFRFRGLAAVTAGEALLRLVLVLLALLTALAPVPVFAAAAAAGALVGVPVLLRHMTLRRGPDRLLPSLRRTATLMLGNAMSAVLVTGAGVLVGVTMRAAPQGDVGQMQAAVTVSRFPLIGLMLLHSLLVPVFTRRHSLYAGRDVAWLAAVLVVVIPASGALSYVGGVPLLRAYLGDKYEVAPYQIALLTLGATALGCIQVLVALAVSGDRHRLAPLAFAVTLVVTLLLAWVPGIDLDLRVPVALGLAPLVGFAVALGLTLRWRRHHHASQTGVVRG